MGIIRILLDNPSDMPMVVEIEGQSITICPNSIGCMTKTTGTGARVLSQELPTEDRPILYQATYDDIQKYSINPAITNHMVGIACRTIEDISQLTDDQKKMLNHYIK